MGSIPICQLKNFFFRVLLSTQSFRYQIIKYQKNTLVIGADNKIISPPEFAAWSLGLSTSCSASGDLTFWNENDKRDLIQIEFMFVRVPDSLSMCRARITLSLKQLTKHLSFSLKHRPSSLIMQSTSTDDVSIELCVLGTLIGCHLNKYIWKVHSINSNLSVCLSQSVSQSVSLSVCLSACLSAFLSQSICLSFCLSVCLSICAPECLSLCVCLLADEN